MEFFDKLGKKASEAYKITADKTGKIAKETKLRIKITELKSQITDLYKEIGKKVYENHIRENNPEFEKEIEELCTKIDVMSDEIENYLKQCLDLRDKKQCPKCFTELEKNDKFCKKCGEKLETENQEKEEINNEEKKEENEVSLISEENNNNQENKIKEKVENLENLEKTVIVETNTNLTEHENEDEIIEKLQESQKEDSTLYDIDEEDEENKE